MSTKNRKRAIPGEAEQYWATLTDEEALLDHLYDKRLNFYDDLQATGLRAIYERSYRAYYGGRVSNNYVNAPLFESSQLTSAGKQGEKTRLKVNHYRNFIQHMHQLVTSSKAAIQARSSNTDYKSQAQTILANGLIDYYWREKNVSRFLADAVEKSLVYLEAFIYSQWSPTSGELYQTNDDGTEIKTGDQKYTLLSPWEVIRDPSLHKPSEQTWRIVKLRDNRWDLMAKHPEKLEVLKEAASASADDANDQVGFQLRGGNDPINADIVNVYHFTHDRTDSMPGGRLIIYIDEAVLFDGPLPYSENPVYRIASKDLHETIYGYSLAVDLLGIQEAIDELTTALMSNNKTFSIQSLWMDINDKISVSTLEGGMRLFKSNVKPEALQLTASSPEAYQFLNMLENWAETISGISSTVRGQPEASLKSGTALALVVSQSIQFINGLEESYNRLIEDVGSSLIYNLRDFSTTPRVAMIMGAANRPFAKTFTADDLNGFNRCVVDRASPMSKTVAGRAEIANNLLNAGMIATPEEYIMVLTTGQLDPAIQQSQSALLNVRAENEELREGRPVRALITENHLLHIQEHKSLVENPDAKNDEQLISLTLAHIQEHLDLWQSATPALLMATGQQMPPPPPMMAAPQGMPAQAPVAAPESMPDAMSTVPPVEQIAADVNMPNMPGLPPGAPPESQAAYEQMITEG